ncbi:LacI family DNA-binding transcriptional regulator [Georgenia halophila]|uniref:LacI family DNA-binding transcriptional regulator n=1 Tax=Georgenia halophila TaxID=620889 RepID=A0ABP8KZM1_9MICO
MGRLRLDVNPAPATTPADADAGAHPDAGEEAAGPDGEGTLRRRSATIQDVADEAGVSRAAVSKVIRDAYGVSPEMRQRVEAVIARLDYRPRVAARAMRGSSFTLGLEIPQIGNDFHSVMAAGATDFLAETPYQLVIAPIRDPQEGDKAIQSLADRQVDGIVAVAPLVSSDWLDRLAERIPVVMVGRHDISTRYDTVAGDDEAGAEEVMEHLIELGHRHIAFLDIDRRRGQGGRSKTFISPTGRDPHAIRRRVYHEHMGALGLPPRVVNGAGHMEEDAAAAVRPLLDDDESRPTAIFAGHDTLAVGALRAIAAAGLDAHDVSVAGFDDIPIASHPMISLTSVDQQGYAIGQEAIRLLLERMGGRTEAVRLQMPTTLRVRGSTAPPRRR